MLTAETRTRSGLHLECAKAAVADNVQQMQERRGPAWERKVAREEQQRELNRQRQIAAIQLSIEEGISYEQAFSEFDAITATRHLALDGSAIRGICESAEDVGRTARITLPMEWRDSYDEGRFLSVAKSGTVPSQVILQFGPA